MSQSRLFPGIAATAAVSADPADRPSRSTRPADEVPLDSLGGMLWGRDAELATVEELCVQARDGHGGALVIRGEAGIGKTALAAEAARRCGGRVLRGVGTEAESDLPFAGLHALIGSESDRIAALPAAQAAAVSGALGLSTQTAGDPLRVGLGLLTLLADLAGEEPVLCVIDDAHWLDRSSLAAVLFAARRLEAEPVAIILTVREELAPRLATPGLPELWLEGLDAAAADTLLRHHRSELSAAARQPLLAAAHGNPLALRELPGSIDHRPPTRHPLHHEFLDRLARLPDSTLALLAVAAMDDTGQSQVVLSAAGRLGADVTDAEPAVAVELARLDHGGIALRHPLVRTAIGEYLPLSTRIAAHRALAEVLSTEADADRRAWHLAAVTFQPDDAVASELERTARRARSRGGFASEFAATARAADLSVDDSNRRRRLRIAARAAVDAGQLDDAQRLAEQAVADTADEEQRAPILAVQATIAEENRQPSQAHDLLVSASTLTSDSGEAAELLFRAIDTAITAGDLDAVRRDAVLARQSGADAASLLGRAALGFGSDEVADGVCAVRELAAALPPSRLPWRQRPLTLSWQLLLGDDEAMRETAETLATQCRQQGAIGALPWVLSGLARAQWNTGRPHDARASLAEGIRLATETGQRLSGDYLFSIAADLAAIDGDTTAPAAGGLSSVLAACAHSLREVGRGNHQQVWRHREVLLDPSHRMFTFAALPDVIEAAAGLGRGDQVTEACEWFTAWADHTGQHWARGVAHRCRALLTASEDHYVRAMELHDRDAVRPFERARTGLAYGAWLRRHRGPRAAHPVLRSAAEIFESLSAKQWIQRSRVELRAAGEGHTPAGTTPLGRLTPQELQVVRLAAAGLSNRDIGDRLFISPRTAGYHLSNAYPKLEVASRRELARLDLRG